jgi:hypothetical protein
MMRMMMRLEISIYSRTDARLLFFNTKNDSFSLL